MSDIRSILVIKLKHIGDVLLASSVFEALHRRYPQARLSALVPRGTEEMLSNNPHVHEILIFDRAVKRFCLGSWIGEETRLIQQIRKRKFDVVVELSGGDRGAILAYCSGSPIRLGYHRRKGMPFRDKLFTHVVNHEFTKSVVDSHGDVLRPLGLTGPMPVPRLYPAADARRQVQQLLGELGVGAQEPIIVFHPTSRWMFKSWEAHACALLADWLSGTWGTRVVLTCGPEEKELKKIRQILSLVREPIVNLAGKTTLSELAALIASARAFIGVDSAPMHMAYALDIPSLSLFGPSDPVQWAPRGSQHRVLSKHWACQPCQRDGCLGSKVSQCLIELGVQEVTRVLADWLPGILQTAGAGKP